MRSAKIILLAALLFFLVGLFFVVPMTAQAGNGVVLPTNTGLADSTVAEILTTLLNWLLEIVGIIAIIGFVASGIMYLVSAGDEEMIKNAKKYMTYCIVGIVVVLGSFAVVKTIDTILNAGGGSSGGGSSVDPYSSYPSTGNREADPAVTPYSSYPSTGNREADPASTVDPYSSYSSTTESREGGQAEPSINTTPANSSTNGVDPNLDPGI